MIQPKWFKDKILGELDASYNYMKKAIDVAKHHPDWAYAFKVMSDDRYDHSEKLYKMFIDYYREDHPEQNESYMNSIRDVIIETLTDKTRLIDGYKVTYDLLIGSEEEIQNESDSTD